MTSFESAIEFVLAQEGGLSTDPDDPGGLTKFGISQRSYPDLDIRKLTKTAATGILYKDYWLAAECDKMPFPIAIMVFDAAVNQGKPTAVGMLQKALKVTVDGVVGPQTLRAVRSANIQGLVCALVAKRAMKYAQSPQLTLYGPGWFQRLAVCHAESMTPF